MMSYEIHGEGEPVVLVPGSGGSGRMAAFFKGDRQIMQGENGLTDEDLRAWRAAATTRGRRTTKK